MKHNKIKEARTSSNLTQQEMADRLGISRRTLIALEQQETLVNRHLEDIARETGTTIPQLTGYAVLDDDVSSLNDIRSLFSDKEKAIEAMHKSELGIKETEIKGLRERLEDRESRIKDLEDRIRRKDSTIRRLQKQLDACSNESRQTEGQDAEND